MRTDTGVHIYLCTELEINHDDADLRAGHHQDDEDQEQEAKEVIKLVLPDGLCVETSRQRRAAVKVGFRASSRSVLTLKMKKSSMNMAPNGKIPAIRILEEKIKEVVKGTPPQKKNTYVAVMERGVANSPHKLVHVPALLGDLPRDLIGADRVIVRLLTETKIVSQVDQRHGDAKPHAEQGQHGGEGDLGGQGGGSQCGQTKTSQTFRFVLVIFASSETKVFQKLQQLRRQTSRNILKVCLEKE